MWCFLPSEENLLWFCHGCTERQLSVGHLLDSYATLRLLLLQESFYQSFLSVHHKAATCSLLVLLQGRTQPILTTVILRITGAHVCDQTVPLVLLLRSEVRHNKGYGKWTQDKTLQRVSGCVLALTKQRSNQQELRQWGLERGPTHSPTSQPWGTVTLKQLPLIPVWLCSQHYSGLPHLPKSIHLQSSVGILTPGIIGFFPG